MNCSPIITIINNTGADAVVSMFCPTGSGIARGIPPGTTTFEFKCSPSNKPCVIPMRFDQNGCLPGAVVATNNSGITVVLNKHFFGPRCMLVATQITKNQCVTGVSLVGSAQKVKC